MACLATPAESAAVFGPMFDAPTAERGRRYLPLILCAECGRERRHRVQVVKVFLRRFSCVSCGELRIYGVARTSFGEGDALDE